MSYTIQLTNGNIVTTVPDTQTVSTFGGLTLLGKNSVGFGTAFNDNLVHMVEHFADSTPPANPFVGQIWYDTVSNSINFWNGSQFQTVGILIPSPTPPLDPQLGDEWFNTINQQLNIWNGYEWVLIGPENQSAENKEGFVVETFQSGTGPIYYLQLYANNELLGIVSSVAFTNPGFPGFGNIRPGWNFVTNPEPAPDTAVESGIYNISELTIGDSDQTAFFNDIYDNTVMQNNGGNVLIATNGNVAAYNYANSSEVVGTVFANVISAKEYIGIPQFSIPATIGQVIFNNGTEALGTSLAIIDTANSNVIINAQNLVTANTEYIGKSLIVGSGGVQAYANGLAYATNLDVASQATVDNLIVTNNATVEGTATFNTGTNAFSLPTTNCVIQSGTPVSNAPLITYANGVTGWSNISLDGIIGSGLFATNGYFTFPGGLMIQWMTGLNDVPAQERGEITETWPVPFPNNCFHVQATVLLDNTITHNAQQYAFYVEPGNNQTSVSLYYDAGPDGVGDTTHRALLFGIGN